MISRGHNGGKTEPSSTAIRLPVYHATVKIHRCKQERIRPIAMLTCPELHCCRGTSGLVSKQLIIGFGIQSIYQNTGESAWVIRAVVKKELFLGLLEVLLQASSCINDLLETIFVEVNINSLDGEIVVDFDLLFLAISIRTTDCLSSCAIPNGLRFGASCMVGRYENNMIRHGQIAETKLVW